MTQDKWKQTPVLFMEVLRELNHSYDKHGNWNDKTPAEIFCIVHEELIEAYEAMMKQDRDGPHGFKVEFCQVAACAIKAILELGGKDGTNQNSKTGILDTSHNG